MSKIALRTFFRLSLSNSLFTRNINRLLLAISIVFIHVRISHAELPVKCDTCGVNADLGWVQSGSVTSNINGGVLNINQTSDKLRLNWQTFNIGVGNTVNFQQPDNGVSINRVFDSSANPSRILGNLNANGQVYIINRNGIVFGEGAKVNVQGIIASTLDISNEVFELGLTEAFKQLNPAFSEDASRVFVTDGQGNELTFKVDQQGQFIFDLNGNLIPDNSPVALPYPIFIKISKNAKIETDSGGKVMIFSQNIENNGRIITPDGQAILAAGNKIYLQTSKELRGFVVEVDVDAVSNQALDDYIASKNAEADNPALQGNTEALVAGNVINRGEISAKRGNVSLAGLSINQQGRVSATTAVNSNGQIRLMARDSVVLIKQSDETTKIDEINRGGYVQFARGSLTEIQLDTDTADALEIDATLAKPSRINVVAQSIEMQENSRIIAPSGEVGMTATAKPVQNASVNLVIKPNDPNARIHLSADSIIDVAGANVKKTMESNIIEAELRGTELADSPWQRDGILAGQTVFVDLRKIDKNGRIPIANLQGQLNNIQRTVAERSTVGGEVSLSSSGRIDFDQNAKINVSGGSVEYADGFIKTTTLVSNGTIFDINDAPANVRYDRIQGQIVRRNRKWNSEQRWNTAGSTNRRFEKGYIEGRDAGSVSFSAYNMTISGDLQATTQASEFQRVNQTLAEGGQLIIGDATGQNNLPNYFAPNVLIQSARQIEILKFQYGEKLKKQFNDIVFLDKRYLEEGRFSRTNIYSNGKVQVDTTIDVAAGGVFSISAAEISVNQDITVPSGEIRLNAHIVKEGVRVKSSESALISTIERSGGELNIADNVTLSTQGNWVNDHPDSTQNLSGHASTDTIALNGGSITVQTSGNVGRFDLNLGDNVSFDASAGAWLDVNGKFKSGKGGNITIDVAATGKYSIGKDLSLKAYSFNQGGSLNLKFPEVFISGSQDTNSQITQHRLWAQGQSSLIDSMAQDDLATSLLTALNEATIQLGITPEIPGGELNDTQIDAIAGLVRQSIGAQPVFQQALKLGDNVLLQNLINPIAAQYNPAATDAENIALIISSMDTVKAVEIPVSLFNEGGFSSYNIVSKYGDLIVTTGSTLKPQIQNIVFDQDYIFSENDTSLFNLGQRITLPGYLRRPIDITLDASFDGVVAQFSAANTLPMVRVEKGATIAMEIGAKLNLTSNGTVDVEGAISAAGGEININVNSSDDTGTTIYDPERKIIVGSQASLETRGTVIYRPDEQGLRIADNIDAGNIRLRAKGGSIDIQDGALLDVSGSSTEQDIINPVDGSAKAVSIATAAGAIEIVASEGMLIKGDLMGQAGDGGRQAGSLKIALDINLIGITDRQNLQLQYPKSANQNWTIMLNQAKQVGDQADVIGVAQFSTEQLRQGGFDALQLVSNIIEIENGVQLRLDRNIILESSVLSISDGNEASTVLLDAPFLSVGPNPFLADTNIPAAIRSLVASGGAGSLILGGDRTHFVELLGNTITRGIERVEINSHGDIRLRALDGGFSVGGDLALTAAQVYTSSLSKFRLESANTDSGRIHIAANNNEKSNAIPVISAGGQLTLSAPEILQEGVLKAPLGSIIFEASSSSATNVASVTLADGSITSTAADVSLVPFGVTTRGGSRWTYSDSSQTTTANDLGERTEQSVAFKAPSVAVNPGAMVDISGGGDLVAYEFLLGPGGSQDVTSAAVAQAENTYAILPWLANAYAPYDTQIYNAGWQDLTAGSSVVINETAGGLPAGEYPLLPAVYALLPGAFLVTATGAYDNIQIGQKLSLADGTPIVAGKRTVMNTAVEDMLTSGFAIRPGSYARTRTEYRETLLSEFLTRKALLDDLAVPRLARDAGRLIIAASKNIRLDGDFISDANGAGRGAEVDISADALVIVGSIDENNLPAGSVVIQAQALQNLGAESILIGGRRQSQADGKRYIEVSAGEVSVATDTQLSAAEIILVASAIGIDGAPLGSGQVSLAVGSVISTRGEIVGTSADIVVGKNQQLDDNGNLISAAVKGDGVLIRVANGNQVAIERVNESSDGTAQGTALIEQGARLQSTRSMNIDASMEITLNGVLDVKQGSLNLGASKINIDSGETALPDGVQGLVLTVQRLNDFSLNELILTSRNSIDFYGNVKLGMDANDNPVINSIDLQTTGINAMTNGSRSQVVANRIRLTNPVSMKEAQAENTTSGASLDLQARRGNTEQVSAGEFIVGGGTFRLDGFDQVAIRADGDLTGEGVGELTVQSALRIDAARISTESGAKTTINANNNRLSVITHPLSETSASSVDSLGGQFTLSGSSIDYGGRIELPSGVVRLLATGDGGQLSLNSGSIIDVSGRSRLMGGERQVSSWGGDVTLDTNNGNILIEEGATVDVSGANSMGIEGGSDAGTLSVFSRNGEVDIRGKILAKAQTNRKGGGFILDAQRLATPTATDNAFSLLSALLNRGNFNQTRKIRLRSGDIEIQQGVDYSVIANQVEIVADAGKINVSGAIDARGDKGGWVSLYARDDVTLLGSAKIDASAHGEAQKGGKVLLSTQQGIIRVHAKDSDNAFTINVAGTAEKVDQLGQVVRDDNGQAVLQHGTVILRAPRVGDNAVALGTIKSDGIINAEKINIEAYKVYGDVDLPDDLLNGGKTINQSVINTLKTQTNAFMLNAPTILAALNADIDQRIQLLPGVEIRSDTSLTLSNDWDLLNWKYNGIPGALSLRAAGDLVVNGSISDGIKVERAGINVKQRLSTIDSWSYRLTAGGDLTSANPNSIVAKSQLVDGRGNLILSAGKKIRTGTGDIIINSGRDLVLKDKDSVIVTSGKKTVDGSPVLTLPLPGSRTVKKEFPYAGGDIRLSVGNNIVGALSDQLYTEWLWRQGGDTTNDKRKPTEWAVDFSKFAQGIATFGGGDIDIDAQGSISDLSVSIATTGIQVGDNPEDILVRGGGDLIVSAKGNIAGGSYFVALGTGRLRTQGGVGKGGANSKGLAIPTLLAVSDGKINIEALHDIDIASVISPTVISRILGVGPLASFSSDFFSYTDKSAVSLVSLTGDIDPKSVAGTSFNDFWFNKRQGVPKTLAAGLDIYPASVNVTAFNGTINSSKLFTTFPSPIGSLQLLAGRDIVLKSRVSLSDYDAAFVSTYKHPITSNYNIDNIANLMSTGHAETLLHANDAIPVYIIADKGSITGNLILAKQARIIAGKDITDLQFIGQNIDSNSITLISAGRDIRYSADDNANNKISVGGPGRLDVIAGRHIDLGGSDGITTSGNIANPALPEFGADITLLPGIANDLGYQEFIAHYLKVHASQGQFRQVLRDKSENQGLSLAAAIGYFDNVLDDTEQQGVLADLQLQPADLGHLRQIADYEAQLDDFALAVGGIIGERDITMQTAFESYNSFDESQRKQLQVGLDRTAEELAKLSTTYDYRVNAARLVALFSSTTQHDKNPVFSQDNLLLFSNLDTGIQRPIVVEALFNELRQSGRRVANKLSEDYSRAYAAIETLFPQDNAYAGNLSMFTSRIYTLDGGNINILVPGGAVNGGLTDPSKVASKLGVVAQAQGEINSYSHGDFIVNQSRVFTLLGGDILMWSTSGDIDAGRGAKTAISAPAPDVSFDKQGNVIINISGAISGSGIRAITTDDNVVAGNVDLFAPTGVIDAGDAGIGGNNITIGATQVLGTNNFDIGGISVGVPNTNAGNLNVGLASVSGVSSRVTKSVENSMDKANRPRISDTPISDAVLSYLEVFVLGFGDDDPEQQDEDLDKKVR